MLFAEAAAGYIAGGGTDAVFYVLDSYKVQRQMGMKHLDWRSLSKGLVSLSLSGSAPSIATFFVIYTPLKRQIQASGWASQSGVLFASVCGAVPASLVAVPADVIKKQVVLGLADSPGTASRSIWRKAGLRGFFVGWQANMIKDVPFAAVKMSLYEGIVQLYMHLASKADLEPSPLEASGAGLASGVVSAIMTNPLDVVNTRIKAAAVPTTSVMEAGRMVVKRDGAKALLAGVGPRMFIIGFGSSLFWSLYSTVKMALAPSDDSMPVARSEGHSQEPANPGR